MARITQETIPDDGLLYCWVPSVFFDAQRQRVMSCVFKNPDQSSDWSKYSTPEQTVNRHRGRASIIGVMRISAGDCRTNQQDVVHDPLGEEDENGPNDAHAEIRGKKTNSIKSKLRDLAVFINVPPVHT